MIKDYFWALVFAGGILSQALQQWQAGHEPACVGAQACELERQGPYPLAFRWGGFLDNWWGVIYNPSTTPIDVEQQRQGFFGRCGLFALSAIAQRPLRVNMNCFAG